VALFAFVAMDIRQLKTLIAIAEHGTFAGAAEAVHLTPSAVSQQMQSLESEIGCSLFNRSTRPPSLNTQGLQMLDAATRLVDTASEAIETIRGNRISGIFTIGSVRTSVFGLLPRALATLKSRYPDLKICLKTGLSTSFSFTLLLDVWMRHWSPNTQAYRRKFVGIRSFVNRLTSYH